MLNCFIGGYDEPSIFDPQESEPSTAVPHIQNVTRVMIPAMEEPHYQREEPDNWNTSMIQPQISVPQERKLPVIRPEPQDDNTRKPEPEQEDNNTREPEPEQEDDNTKEPELEPEPEQETMP